MGPSYSSRREVRWIFGRNPMPSPEALALFPFVPRALTINAATTAYERQKIFIITTWLLETHSTRRCKLRCSIAISLTVSRGLSLSLCLSLFRLSKDTQDTTKHSLDSRWRFSLVRGSTPPRSETHKTPPKKQLPRVPQLIYKTQKCPRSHALTLHVTIGSNSQILRCFSPGGSKRSCGQFPQSSKRGKKSKYPT